MCFLHWFQIDVLNVDDVKSPEAKEVHYDFGHSGLFFTFVSYNVIVLQLWRPFCNQFEGKVKDFNFGTLLR